MAAAFIHSRLCNATRSSLRSYRQIFRYKASWNILNVNHIGVAGTDLDKSVKFYKDVLGAKICETVNVPDFGVKVVYVDLLNTKIELLAPHGNPQSPLVEAFFEKNPAGGMHHIGLEVDSLKDAAADLKAKNIRLLCEEPQMAPNGKRYILLHPDDCGGVLIELDEA